jgi:hypothetical protein
MRVARSVEENPWVDRKAECSFRVLTGRVSRPRTADNFIYKELVGDGTLDAVCMHCVGRKAERTFGK